MLENSFLKQVWGFIREYLVILILIAGTCKMFINVYATGTRPMPQQPPEGYLVERTEATFQWNRGNRSLPIQLQVSKDDSSFKNPTLDRKVTGTTHTMHDLEPGHVYYWRLQQGDDTSPLASFKTADNAVTF